MNYTMKFLRCMLCVIGLLFVNVNAFSQAYPTKPIRLVVFGPAGGLADQLARLLSTALPPHIGQPVIVENKPGGAAAPAINEIKIAHADGHTLLLGLASLVTELPHAFKVQYAPFQDIRPIAEVARGGLMLVGNASLPQKNLQEVILEAKRNPGKVLYASYSPGTISHVMGLQLNKAAGIELVHVGYKGSPPALQDVMAGHVPLAFDVVANVVPYLKAEKLKGYAVSTPARSAMFPDIPTFRELGYPDLENTAAFLVYVNPQVPLEVQNKLRGSIATAMREPAVLARLEAINLQQGRPLTSEAITAGLKIEYEKIGDVLRSVNYKPD